MKNLQKPQNKPLVKATFQIVFFKLILKTPWFFFVRLLTSIHLLVVCTTPEKKTWTNCCFRVTGMIYQFIEDLKIIFDIRNSLRRSFGNLFLARSLMSKNHKIALVLACLKSGLPFRCFLSELWMILIRFRQFYGFI